jgi:putative phosphoribosyl transferase
MAEPRFDDRREGGRALAALLHAYAGQPDVRVLALPRGGVPVGYEVARALGAPLDVFLVRKLGAPSYGELAMGAIADGGVRVLNPSVISRLGISEEDIERVAAAEAQELARRARRYRHGREPTQVRGKTVILVDDGLATGSTMRAAVAALRQQGPRRLVVAVPVAAASTCEALVEEVDEVACATTPEPFYAVGQWYRDFEQTDDEEVHALLALAAQEQEAAHGVGR